MRRTIVVEGPLAFRMRRIEAARRAEAGLQIVTLPQLAARLAGGFVRPAGPLDLDPAIRLALAAGGFAELESIRQLPGMTRSVAWTLARVWESDISLADRIGDSARLQDVATIEARVRANLPTGALTPRDLRDAALNRLTHATAIVGPIEFDGVDRVASVWKPLIRALARTVRVTWLNPGTPDVDWFPGEVKSDQRPAPAVPEIVSCSTPRGEVVEALRWARALMASGRARPEEIAICATGTENWDEHMLVLGTNAGLPLHFSHGLPALASREGQACAALADVLLNGLSQNRVSRLVAHTAGRSRGLNDLPRTWAQGLQPGAALFELDHWRRALDEAHGRRTDGLDVRPFLIPVLESLAKGPEMAQALGELLLDSAARALWREALRRAPPQALEFSLQELRLPDGRDPGACAVWCPASHVAASPRRWVRLLGMTSRSWPRRAGESPLVPSHVLSRDVLDPDPITDRDRRAFQVLAAHATGGCVLSRSRRSVQGSQLAVSPLVPHGVDIVLKRSRIPNHAFSEADRLLARPAEAAALPPIAAANNCWHNRRSSRINAHDGQVRGDHPIIERAINQVQSATSLRLLLRDPLAFVWRYALDWRSLVEDDQPLTLDARVYGELVHELLKRAVDALEPDPGYARATHTEIEAALEAAVATIAMQWPLARSVPPLLLWRHTLVAARELALRALTLDEAFQADTRSWTELAFGLDENEREVAIGLPWPPTAQVTIPVANVRIRGSIDRLDLNGARNAVRVSDYKTGLEPRQADRIVLGRGAELQRVIYAFAARQLLPDNPRIVARLVFLGDEEPRAHRLPDVDQAIIDMSAHVGAANDLLRRGVALPGPDAREEWNEFRLALPAAPTTYFQIKQAAIGHAFGDFARIWSAP